MDERTGIKKSGYVFGGGVLLQILVFASLRHRIVALTLFFTAFHLMAIGLLLNLKAKGHNPFKKMWFYPTVLILLWPLIGPLAAMGVMFGTPAEGVPSPRWRTILFSPWTITLSLCLIICLVAIPQFYAFRAASAQAQLKWAKYHLDRARDSEMQENFFNEIEEATAQFSAARREALTDANAGWFVRTSLGDRIIKESQLAELAAAIEAAKSSGIGTKKK